MIGVWVARVLFFGTIGGVLTFAAVSGFINRGFDEQECRDRIQAGKLLEDDCAEFYRDSVMADR